MKTIKNQIKIINIYVSILKILLFIITSVLKIINPFRKDKIDNRIEDDKEIADHIRKGDGRKIGEIWKRRRKYGG